MLIIASIMSQWRYGLWGLLTVGFVIFALQVSHWYSRARAADIAEANYRQALKDITQYQVDLVDVGKQLREKKTEVIMKTNDVIRIIPKYIHDSPNCSFSADVIRVLNSAKRVSPASPGVARDPEAVVAGSGGGDIDVGDGKAESPRHPGG